MPARRKTDREIVMLKQDYDYVFSRSSSEHCYSLTKQHIAALLALSDYLGWQTRWYSPTEQTINTDQIEAFTSDLVWRLMNPVQCGQPTNDEDCFTYLPNSPFIEWFPHDPFSQPDLVTEGYSQPAWYVANQAEKTVMTDLSRFPPGSLPGIIPASGLPRFRLHLNSESGGVVELHLISMVAGSLCQITVDDNPLSARFIDLDTDITSVPPESGGEVIAEVYIPAGNHHVDCIIVSQVNESIPFIHHGGGLASVVLCGVGVGQSMYTPQFRFINCVLEYSLDGVNWLPVPGWPENAGTCFEGPPGQPGQDGADGCSPTVWVEDRPSDNHKILWIDADCDDLNDYEVDLTAEAQAGQVSELACRFARSFSPEFCKIVRDALGAMITAWDGGEVARHAAFIGSWPIFVGAVTEQIMYELAALQQTEVQGIFNWVDDTNNWDYFASDLWFAPVGAEWHLSTINAIQARVLNSLNRSLSEKYVVRLVQAAWADDTSYFETWTWDAMAHPLAGDCSQFIDDTPETFWEHEFDFRGSAQGFTFEAGQFATAGQVSAVGLMGTWDTQHYNVLWAHQYHPETHIIWAKMTGGFGNDTYIQLEVRNGDNTAWLYSGLNISQVNMENELEMDFLTTGLRVSGVGATDDQSSYPILERLIIRGTGYNPFE